MQIAKVLAVSRLSPLLLVMEAEDGTVVELSLKEIEDGRHRLSDVVLWFNENGHLDKGDKIGKGGVPPWQRNDVTMAMNSSERRSGW